MLNFSDIQFSGFAYTIVAAVADVLPLLRGVECTYLFLKLKLRILIFTAPLRYI